MWLIIAALAAVISTMAWIISKTNKYRLAELSMAFWALTIMVFIDHTIGWILEGEGDFMDINFNALVLSLCMIFPIIMIWEAFLVKDKIVGKRAPASKDDEAPIEAVAVVEEAEATEEVSEEAVTEEAEATEEKTEEAEATEEVSEEAVTEEAEATEEKTEEDEATEEVSEEAVTEEAEATKEEKDKKKEE